MEVCISKCSRKYLVSLKRIIHIITVFITRTYRFWPVRGDLSYNNLITFRNALSSTPLNDQLYLLMGISYYTDNPSQIRHILTPPPLPSFNLDHKSSSSLLTQSKTGEQRIKMIYSTQRHITSTTQDLSLFKHRNISKLLSTTITHKDFKKINIPPPLPLSQPDIVTNLQACLSGT